MRDLVTSPRVGQYCVGGDSALGDEICYLARPNVQEPHGQEIRSLPVAQAS